MNSVTSSSTLLSFRFGALLSAILSAPTDELAPGQEYLVSINHPGNGRVRPMTPPFVCTQASQQNLLCAPAMNGRAPPALRKGPEPVEPRSVRSPSGLRHRGMGRPVGS